MKRQRETAKTEMKGLDWVLPGKTEVETQGREIQVELIASQLTLGLRATYMFRPKPESCFLFLLRPEDWGSDGQAPGTGCIGWIISAWFFGGPVVSGVAHQPENLFRLSGGESIDSSYFPRHLPHSRRKRQA